MKERIFNSSYLVCTKGTVIKNHAKFSQKYPQKLKVILFKQTAWLTVSPCGTNFELRTLITLIFDFVGMLHLAWLSCFLSWFFTCDDLNTNTYMKEFVYVLSSQQSMHIIGNHFDSWLQIWIQRYSTNLRIQHFR